VGHGVAQLMRAAARRGQVHRAVVTIRVRNLTIFEIRAVASVRRGAPWAERFAAVCVCPPVLPVVCHPNGTATNLPGRRGIAVSPHGRDGHPSVFPIGRAAWLVNASRVAVIACG